MRRSTALSFSLHLVFSGQGGGEVKLFAIFKHLRSYKSVNYAKIHKKVNVQVFHGL